MIVVGDSDRVAVPARQGYRLHNQVHRSRLVVLPNAGHMIHITRPDAGDGRDPPGVGHVAHARIRYVAADAAAV